MTYSYTQISQYLSCPRRYRYRYVDGWQEKDTRASMLFGRAFEKALAAYFRREDCGDAFFREWSAFRTAQLEYPNRTTWDQMLHQGVHLLERFAQDDRVRIPRPSHNLQVKLLRTISRSTQFVSYIDAIGELDDTRTLIDWKTTSACYPERPDGLLTLDPQLVCYSWISGEPNVAFVVFVRKRAPEIQYLRATISDAQREEFGRLVAHAVQQIEARAFQRHSGIRFPQNACLHCPYLGLCLDRQELVVPRLLRQPAGDDLGWLDELTA